MLQASSYGRHPPLLNHSCLLCAAPHACCSAGTFDAAAKASQLQQASPSQHQQQPQLRLAVSAALWAALQRCIAADVFLQALADRFAKLAFQLLVRYDSWLQDVASTRQAALAAPTAAPGTAAGPAAAGAAAPGSPAAGAGAAGGTAAAAGPAGWAGSMGAEECAAICADANALQVRRMLLHLGLACLQHPVSSQHVRVWARFGCRQRTTPCTQHASTGWTPSNLALACVRPGCLVHSCRSRP